MAKTSASAKPHKVRPGRLARRVIAPTLAAAAGCVALAAAILTAQLMPGVGPLPSGPLVNGEALATVADVRLAAASRMATPSQTRKRSLDEAEALTRRELTLRPSNAVAWARLAGILSLRDGALSPPAAAALEQSYRHAPTARELLEWRLLFGLGHWRTLPSHLRVETLSQADLLWREPRNRRRLRRYLSVTSDPSARLALALRLDRLHVAACGADRAAAAGTRPAPGTGARGWSEPGC